MEMSTATRFDSIVVVRVHETIPAFRSPSVKSGSVRALPRKVLRSVREIGQSIVPARKSARAVMDTRSFEPNNIAHLLMHIIPYCIYARDVAGPDTEFLFRRTHPRFEDLLRIFNIEPVARPQAVEADVIHVRGTRGFAVYELFSVFDCVALDYLPQAYADIEFGATPGYERVFLARRDGRRITNQAEIERLLQGYGYTTVFMEDYPLSKQLSIGAHAKRVVAIHGGAMGFLSVNSAIDSVIEIMPPNVYHEFFPVALGARVKHYEQIIPEFSKAVAHSGWPAICFYKDRPFHLDPGMLEERLAAIHLSPSRTVETEAGLD